MPHALLYCYAAQNQARPSAAGYHHAHISAAITATRTLHLSKRSLGDYSVLIGGVLRWTGWRVLALVLGPKAGLLHCQCHQRQEWDNKKRTYSCLRYKHRSIMKNTKNQTRMMHTARTAPRVCRPLLSKPTARASVAVTYPRLDINSSCPCICQMDGRHTRAVFGNTNENHVI